MCIIFRKQHEDLCFIYDVFYFRTDALHPVDSDDSLDMLSHGPLSFHDVPTISDEEEDDQSTIKVPSIPDLDENGNKNKRDFCSSH